MENKYTKLPSNNDEDIRSKAIDFEFIRQRNIFKENIDQQKPFSILQKTNNIFALKNEEIKNLDSKIYDTSIEQKENINFYSNQSKNSDNNNLDSNINRIQNKINDLENNINLINNTINKDTQMKFNFERKLETDKIITNYKPIIKNENNNNFIPNNNSFNKNISNIKGYYFNYKSDDSFNKLNEKNTQPFPIDIKSNLIYNTKTTTSFINSTQNENEYRTNSITFNMKKIERNNDNNYYKGYMNEIEKRNDLINKDTFESINKNINIDYNYSNQDDMKNNLKKDFSSKQLSVNKDIITEEKYKLDYNISNNLQSSKSNNNIFINYDYNNQNNNDSLYNTEKRNNIESYFQLKGNDNLYKINNTYTSNIIPSNKNDQTLSSLTEETNKEIFNFTNKDLNNVNPIKNLKNYHSFSTPRNHYININNNIEEITKQKTKFENIDTNYRMNTNGNENKRDEMTQTVQVNDVNKFYSFTQNRNYRNQKQFTVDNSSQTYNDDNFDKKYHNTNININKTTNYENFKVDNPEINDENSDNNRQFNTVSNNTCQLKNNRCIHKCNTYRNKRSNKNSMNLFNRNNNNNNLNFGFNGINKNKTICEKCLKSKMNFAKLTHMRICNNCQKLINNGNFNIDKNNYFTFN